ncbi:MAG: phospholipase D-like domain-containing protein [Eubacteriales bacterium]|nr:phospholipase D-like domain-containing protein [Eubacteriales bacterium]
MKKEYFNIPNLMGYFRILLIPVFLYFYFRGETQTDYRIAIGALALSCLTDFFDGKIARKFNMVTDWGKMLDPIADKLTQGSLAIALLWRYPAMVWFLGVFLCKEIYMSLMGMYLIRKGYEIHGAQFFGKVCTAVVDGVMIILVLMPDLPLLKVNLLIVAAICVMLVTVCRYFRFHYQILKNRKPEKIKVPVGWLLLALAAYILTGAVVPYIRQPEVSREYQQNFHTEDFYSDKPSCDRAAILEDNGEALEERIRAISQAEESLIMSTFDFRSDTAGMQMIAALKDAAGRGVQVKILVDGFNSWLRMAGNPYFYALASQENVEIKVYNPVNLLTPWKAMSRMHDKYLIADEKMYILGGRNTFNYFLGSQKSHKNYDRDMLVYNTSAENASETGNTSETEKHASEEAQSSVYQVTDYFNEIWKLDLCTRWQEGKWISHIPGVIRADAELEKLYAEMKKEHPDWFEETDYTGMTAEVNKITLLSNPTGLYSKEPYVFYGLTQLAARAKEEVWIHTPYIMCNEMMYQAFADICGTGIPVTLMTNSVENNGNPFGSVDYALNKEKILDTGLHVLEYEGGVSYHGKSMIIDDDIAIVGSFNMDMKSVYQDTELMLVANSRELNAQLREHLESYQQDAREASLDIREVENLFNRELPFKKRLQRRIIRILDPYLRFLL